MEIHCTQLIILLEFYQHSILGERIKSCYHLMKLRDSESLGSKIGLLANVLSEKVKELGYRRSSGRLHATIPT